MPARNLKSMEREFTPEPSSIVDLLSAVHWELDCLMGEMKEILELPTALYELYPRIRVALELHCRVSDRVLYQWAKDIPEIAPASETLRAIDEKMMNLLESLDRIPRRRDQINSSSWKKEFILLSEQWARHKEIEDNELFPLMKRLVPPSRLESLGDRYKQQLKTEYEEG